MPYASAATLADSASLFLSGGGESSKIIAALDWSSTALGPIATWHPHLKMAVSLVVRSRVPMVILWGPAGHMIYNDGYAQIAAGRHPSIMGMTVREAWPEAAAFNDNVMAKGLAGESLSFRDVEITLNRSGTPEQVWFNLDYSPLVDEHGQPAGVLAICAETTAKVMAERWRDSERERQRQMFEQAPGFMAMLSGPNHVFELANSAYMQLVGHRQVIGLPVREAIPEVERQGFVELLDNVYRSGDGFLGKSVDVTLQRAEDDLAEIRHVDFVFQPVRDPDGKVIGIFVHGIDITDRRFADDALRESEAQFRALAETMPNHAWQATPDGRLEWFNPRVYEYASAAPGELDGDGWITMVHHEDLESAAAAWARSLASGLPYETEFRLRRFDGAYRWHLARAEPVRSSDGAILHWIGTNTDIDDQKRTSQALLESEQRLKLSQSAAGISSLEVDIPTGMVIGSEGFWSLWGLSHRDSINISELEAIVIPEDHNVRSTAETRSKGTAVPHVEYRIRRPDTGELRWLSRHVEFVHDEYGVPVKMFGVMQDVTDRREYESRQKMLTHELEHRIKNLLAMVSAIASRTLKDTDLATAREALMQRLRALGEAHSIMNHNKWRGASMHKVIESTIAAMPMDQISVSGPPLSINPRMALTLALAVNELATNALKYGALSKPEGRVSIEWRVDTSIPTSRESLTWRWQESGGPRVVPPTRRGFGSFLLERVFSVDFGGSVEVDHRPEGLICVLTAPAPSLDAETYDLAG